MVGVISRGLQTDEGDGPTYVSWIIKSLGRPLEISWPPGLHKESASPLSMDRRLLVIERPEALNGTTETRMTYKVWFE